MKDCPREINKCRLYCIVCSCCNCECKPETHHVYNKQLVFSDWFMRKPDCQCTGCKISREQEQMKPCVFEEEKQATDNDLVNLISEKIEESTDKAFYEIAEKIVKEYEEHVNFVKKLAEDYRLII